MSINVNPRRSGMYIESSGRTDKKTAASDSTDMQQAGPSGPADYLDFA